MRRVIDIVTAENLDGGTKWYLIERDDHVDIVSPVTNEPARRGDCLRVPTKADAINLRRQAYNERIPLDTL